MRQADIRRIVGNGVVVAGESYLGRSETDGLCFFLKKVVFSK